MSMDKEQQFCLKIGYPILFSKTEEDAVSNLLRLIRSGHCGFDEGAEFYAKRIQSLLEDSSDLLEGTPLSEFPFTETAFRNILKNLRSSLMSQKEEES